MPNRNHICVIFIAQHLDEFRVIYKSHREWLIDAPENTISGARQRAEQCMQALYLQSACRNRSVNTYEVTIASNLYHALLDGLHNDEDAWQHYLDDAAKILNTRNNVSMASFVTDDNGAHNGQAPHLFMISSDMQTGQHTMDTIQLGHKKPSSDGAIVYKISEGKPRLYIDQPHTDSNTSPIAIDILPRHHAIPA
jgi:hypothetical protein